jgi:hypothetical protein
MARQAQRDHYSRDSDQSPSCLQRQIPSLSQSTTQKNWFHLPFELDKDVHSWWPVFGEDGDLYQRQLIVVTVVLTTVSLQNSHTDIYIERRNQKIGRHLRHCKRFGPSCPCYTGKSLRASNGLGWKFYVRWWW